MEPSFHDLLHKYLAGTLTTAERQALAGQLREPQHLAALERLIDAGFQDDHIMGLSSPAQGDVLYENVLRETGAGRIRRLLPIQWMSAAAVLLILLGSIWLLWPGPRQSTNETVQIQTQSIPALLPGGNKATLILSNGRHIDLDSAAMGALASQSGSKVIKTDSGLLTYQGKTNSEAAVAYNTLSTPKGGQFQIILPDGSHVWLNATSSLRYPAAFPIKGNREVELTGEGYFEIAKDNNKPFRVRVGAMSVQVLGTHFNIMAYPEEAAVKTTLLEGSVKLNVAAKAILLAPGEQAATDPATNDPRFTISHPDLEETIAWKEGRFLFSKTDIKTIMRQLGRWYDIDVDYQGDLSGISLSGMVSRRRSADQLLQVFQETGKVHFESIGRRIVVLPGKAPGVTPK